MTYFSKFPSVPVLTSENKIIFFTDIFIKGKPISEYKNISLFLLPYQSKPEHHPKTH